jgi:hypothetical protein
VSVSAHPGVAAGTLTSERITETLKTVSYPGLTRDLVSLGMVQTVVDESDRGTPTMIERADSTTGLAFDRIAATVAETLGWRRI